MKLYAYKQGSASAKALAEALGIKRIKHEGKPLRVKDGDTIINWGASKINREIVLEAGYARILNLDVAVNRASNKLETFKALANKGVSTPFWSTQREDAMMYLQGGQAVVCRTKLNGHSGEGIVIADNVKKLVDAPLYTGYIKKKEEYRIHVFQGDAFFVQRKARKMDVPDDQVNWQVRNLAGGFIFANKEVDVEDAAKEQAIKAVAALGLDFGAVDIILGTDKQWYVLEVNTACGLEGTTLEKYVAKFQEFR